MLGTKNHQALDNISPVFRFKPIGFFRWTPLDAYERLYGVTTFGFLVSKKSHWIFPRLFGLFFLATGYIFFGHQSGGKGIPNGSRARAVLFQTKSLQKSTAAYPMIGQKKLNGASSRMMIHWMQELSYEIFCDHPTDTNRSSGTKLVDTTSILNSHVSSNSLP